MTPLGALSSQCFYSHATDGEHNTNKTAIPNTWMSTNEPLGWRSHINGGTDDLVSVTDEWFVCAADK